MHFFCLVKQTFQFVYVALRSRKYLIRLTVLKKLKQNILFIQHNNVLLLKEEIQRVTLVTALKLELYLTWFRTTLPIILLIL